MCNQVLLGKKEVAKRLNICERTLENQVTRGKFPPGLKLGKQVVWAEAAVDKWLQNFVQSQLEWKPVQRGRPRKAA